MRSLCLLCLLGPLLAMGRVGQAAEMPAAVPGELLVRFEDAAGRNAAAVAGGTGGAGGASAFARARLRYGIVEMEAVFSAAQGEQAAARNGGGTAGGGTAAVSGVYCLRFDPGASLPEVAAALARDPVVAWVEPNYIYHGDGEDSDETAAAADFDDPFLFSSGSWGQDFPDLWGLWRIEAPAAWEVAQGAGVVVAVIDSGISIQHADLAANLWRNPRERAGNGFDDDGNGYIDDTYGFDFTRCVDRSLGRGTCLEPKQPGGDLGDPLGHGTHVAGTIAAVGGNGFGIVGVAPAARVMMVKGLDRSGTGTSRDLAEALVYAAENGASVVNASWSGPPSNTIALAVDYISTSFDVVVVASAGNDAAPLERGLYPAALPAALAVGATTEADQRAASSNFGGGLDLVAPGGGGSGPQSVTRPDLSILSLLAMGAEFGRVCLEDDNEDLEICRVAPWVVAGDLVRQAGTSMAAPHVSGVAALVRGLHPEFSRGQVRQVLLESADDLGEPGWDQDFGYGRVNALRAVQIESIPVAEISAPENRAKVWVRSFPLRVRGSALGPTVPLASWELTIGAHGSEERRRVAGGSSEVDGGVLGMVDMNQPLALEAGRRYVLELEVEDGERNRATASRVFLVPDPKYALIPVPDRFDEGGSVRGISNDGTRLVAGRFDRRTRNSSVWLFDSATRELRLVADANTPFLSPDGEYIVLAERVPGTAARRKLLYRVTDGSSVVLPDYVETGPLSQGATRMAVLSADDPLGTNPDRSRELFLLDLPAGPLWQITDADSGPGTGIYNIYLSDDGRQAAFSSRIDFDPSNTTGGVEQIFLYDDASGRVRQLTGRPGFPEFGFFPSMNADGSKLVFESLGVHLMNIETDTVEDISGRIMATEPAQAHLSGDGTKLVFVSAQDLDPAVTNEDLGREGFVIDLRTWQVTQVTDMVRGIGIPSVGPLDRSGDTIIIGPSGPLNGIGVEPFLARAVRRRRAYDDNRQPHLDAPESIVAGEGVRTVTHLRASDADGDPITFYAERIPPFVIGADMRLGDLASSELIDHGDGSAELAFTPSYTEAGEYPLRIAAFDEEGGADLVQVRLVIEDTQKEGDADCDGIINAADLAALIRALFDPRARTDCPTADSDGDGRVRANDIVAAEMKMR